MKKSVLLSVLAALLCSLSAYASDSEEIVTRLTLSKLDGTEVHFALANKPEITFADGNLTITDGEKITEYPRSEVADFHFTRGTMTAISQVDADDTLIQFVDNNHIVISGPGITSATAYNLNGIAVAQATAANGSVTLDLSTMAPGVYVVALPGHPSMKFLKK